MMAMVDTVVLAAPRGFCAGVERAIEEAANAPSLTEGLEVGYAAFGASACTAAAREGISAFQERRKPDFTKSG